MTLTTRSAGSLVSVILNRKGALPRAVRESRDYDSAVRARFLTAQWAVAPIEVAVFESRRDHQKYGSPSWVSVFLLFSWGFEHTAAGRGRTKEAPPQCGVPKASDLSSLARNEHRHRSKVPVRRLSERNRIPPGVQKIRQEQQNVETLADFSFPHSIAK